MKAVQVMVITKEWLHKEQANGILSESSWHGGIVWSLKSCEWGKSLTWTLISTILTAVNTAETGFMNHTRLYHAKSKFYTCNFPEFYFPFNTKLFHFTSNINEKKILYFIIMLWSWVYLIKVIKWSKMVEKELYSILFCPPLNSFFTFKNSSVLHQDIF